MQKTGSTSTQTSRDKTNLAKNGASYRQNKLTTKIELEKFNIGSQSAQSREFGIGKDFNNSRESTNKKEYYI